MGSSRNSSSCYDTEETLCSQSNTTAFSLCSFSYEQCIHHKSMLILICICFSPQCAQKKLLAVWVSAKRQTNTKNNKIILISMNTECFCTEELEINFWKVSESQNHSMACWPHFFFFDVTWDTVGFQGCKCSLPSHADLLFSQHS